jgi:spore coat polysaccharide biosynthesis predicted glycosyltransferase SpsG
MKLLFLPNYLGGGFGHIGRCLALAEKARERNFQCAFFLNGPHIEKILQLVFKFLH